MGMNVSKWDEAPLDSWITCYENLYSTQLVLITNVPTVQGWNAGVNSRSQAELRGSAPCNSPD